MLITGFRLAWIVYPDFLIRVMSGMNEVLKLVGQCASGGVLIGNQNR